MEGAKKYMCNDAGKHGAFKKGELYCLRNGEICDSFGHPWKSNSVPGGDVIGFLKGYWGVELKRVA